MQENNAIGELSEEYKPSRELLDDEREDGAVHQSEKLLTRVLLLAISAVLLFFSFLPFAHMKVKFFSSFTVDIKFSNADGLLITPFALSELSEEELVETKLYEWFEEKYSIEQFNANDIADMTKPYMYLSLLGEGTTPMASNVICSLISLAYISICIGFFIICIRSLLVELRNRKKGRPSDERWLGKSYAALWTIFLILPLVGYGFYKMCGCGFLSQDLFLLRDFGMSYGFFVSIFVAGAASIAVIYKKIAAMAKKGKIRSNRPLILNIKTAIIALLMIVTVFIPCLSFDFAETDSYIPETERYYVGAADFSEISASKQDSYTYASISDNYYRLFAIKNNIFTGSGNEKLLINDYYNTLVIGFGQDDSQPVFMAIIFVSMAQLFILMLLVKRCLCEMLLGSRVYESKGFTKLLTVLLSLTQFVLIIAVKFIAEDYMVGSIAKTARINFSVGFVLTLILALAMIADLAKSKNMRVIDSAYDNPDVSYAPYVVK